TEKLSARDSVDYIQALSIAMSMDRLSLRDQLAFADELLVVKELWQIHYKQMATSRNTTSASLADLRQFIKDLAFDDVEEGFNELVSFCMNDTKLIPSLSDNAILNLYERL